MKSKFVKILARVMAFFLPIEGLDTPKILCEVSKSAGGEIPSILRIREDSLGIPWDSSRGFLRVLKKDSAE